MPPLDPEEATASGAPAVAEIPAATRCGPVQLTVADLDRSLAYYEAVFGLRARERADGRAFVGAGGEDLLILDELPGARPARGYCGLYHFALLVPERRDLAAWLAYAARERIELTGLSDHFVSEAIYLRDPDEHGIEIYWDRPREVWEGQVDRRMTTLPLDVESLLGELADPAREPFAAIPRGTVMGHVHLRVADIADTIRFYQGVLGFGLMAALGRQAAFLSAGGYHHHLGMNTWESAGAPPAPDDSATLRQAAFLVPDDETVDRLADALDRDGREPVAVEGGVLVRDPSGNPLALRTSTTRG